MKLTIKIAIVVVVLTAVSLGIGGMYKLTQRRKQAASFKTEKQPLKVAVVRVKTAVLEKKTAVTGEIRALQVVDVVPEVTGRLERLRLPDGTRIEEGTKIRRDPKTNELPVIAIIERDALQAAFQQAEASLKVAEAVRERAKVLLVDCARERKRFERLFEEGATTEQQLDKAVTACDRSEAEVRLAEAQVTEAQAAVRQAKVRLDDATIRAPISGVVTESSIDEGNLVGLTSSLVRISQIDEVKVVCSVSERHFRLLIPGRTAAAVRVDAFPNEQFEGFIYLVEEDVDPVTRTVGVEIRIPNDDLRLKPGMFARVLLVLERSAEVAVVPDTALLQDEQGSYVYVVNGSQARRQSVTLGLAEGVLHEVTSGLKAGEMVIVRGQRQLVDGQAVQPVEEAEK